MIGLDFNVDELIHDTMVSGDKQSLNVYRLMKAEFLKKQTEANRGSHTLTEKEKETIILKMISERDDAIQQYSAANREDLAIEERKELEVLFNFVPKPLSEDEAIDAIKSEIVAYKLEFLKDAPLKMMHMKPIMARLKEKYPTIDGKLVSKTLKDSLD